MKVSQKLIKERCGTVSFKKGEAFYRNGKVTIDEADPNFIRAVVHGLEDFYVTIKKHSKGFQTSCSCPTLASFQKDCQHVAAVLIAWQHQPIHEEHPKLPQEEGLSEKLLALFNNNPAPRSGKQIHFENRQPLRITFNCKVVKVATNESMLGIEISIESQQVANIREFLKMIKNGEHYRITEDLIYHSNEHYFYPEEDAVLQQLIHMMEDEKMYLRAMPMATKNRSSKELLLIPASFWKKIEPLLLRASKVLFDYDKELGIDFQISEEPLPLIFEFTGKADTGYRLRIEGLREMVILQSYDTVLYGRKIIAVKHREINRLYELQSMMKHTNEISIPNQQLKYYMEKLLPSLKKLGEVRLSGELTAELEKTPLQAKLFLDRVRNRLLAGIEFHYKNVVINPLDAQQPQVGSMIIRDMQKEEEILQFMEDSEFSQTESGYYIQNEELEYNFLYHMLPELQKHTQVYATTAVRTRIVPKSNIPPKIKVRHRKERTNWLEFTFEIDGIPNEEIKEVLATLEEKRKYYRLRDGSLFSLETREMEEIQRFLRQVPIQDDEWDKHFQVPVVKGLRLLGNIENSDMISPEASFRNFLSNIQNPGQLPFSPPDSFVGDLRKYQVEGYKWLKSLANFGFGGILADDMGLGKTIQSIAFLLSELPKIRENKQPALIVCPSSVTYNWQSELMKFAPEIDAIIIDGNKPERIALQKDLTTTDVIITSYPLLRSDISWYEKQSFHVVFFDEAQVFKNPLTLTFRTVKKIQANHRFALTGTPIENTLEELWSIFHIVFPELFLGLREYSELTNQQIARRIRPFMLRRTKEDVLNELPSKMEIIRSSELFPEQKKLYASYLAKLKHDTFKHLDRETIRKNRIKILAGITRLRQICCHPKLFVDGYEGNSAKFEQLMEIIEESRIAGRRVLIFSQFTKMLQLIGNQLASDGISYFYLDGSIPSDERVDLCNRYNAGERDIFLISLKAGGTGLNLTGADTVIFYDSWWNPAVESQAADRAHRIGQKNKVHVIKLVAKGTIEEKMNELQDKKRHLIEEVIDPNDERLEKLTEEDIQVLLG